MIVGIGVDIVDIDRVEDMIERHGKRFIGKTFTDGEVAYCEGRKLPGSHYAGRFAAKEAVFKALGTGWREGIGWKEIEVVADQHGKPRLRLTGMAAAKANDLGISDLLLTISHCDCHAVACVVAQAPDRRT